MAETNAGLEIPIGITDKKALQAVTRMVTKMESDLRKVEKAAVTANNGIAKSFGTMSRQSTAQIQNVSYQLQDVFVQISSGTDAARALSQQVPQLLGGFGALGAVLGTVAAVAIPLAANLFMSGEKAKEFEDRLKDLRGTIESYRSSIEQANLTQEEMTAKYAGAAEEARKFLVALQDLRGQDALTSLKSEADSIATMFGGFDRVMADSTGSMSEYHRTLTNIEQGLGLTGKQAVSLADALQRVGMAEGPEGIAEALDNVRNLMSGITVEGEDQKALYDQIVRKVLDIGVEAGNMSGALADATGQTDSWAAAMSGVRAEIGGIAAALSSIGGGMIANASKQVELKALKEGRGALEAARERQRYQLETEFSAKEVAASNWVQKAAVAAERAVAEQSLNLDHQLDDARKAAAEAERAAAKIGRGGGAGKGGGRRRSGGGERRAEPDLFEASERQLVNLEREISLIGKSTAEVARSRAEWAMLDEAKRRGLDINDQLNAKISQQASEVGKLTAQLEAGEIAQQQFDAAVDGIADAFAGALVAGESLRDGLANVFKQIAADILTSGLRQSLMSVFGGTGLFQSFMGGGDKLTGALRIAGAFDKGGYTGAGGKLEPAGVVHRGEYVMDADTVRRAGGPAAFDALRRGLKGYADGGYVGAPVVPSVARASMSRAVGGNATFAPQINIQGDASEKTIAIMQQMLARENAQFVSRWRMAQKEVGQRT